MGIILWIPLAWVGGHCLVHVGDGPPQLGNMSLGERSAVPCPHPKPVRGRGWSPGFLLSDRSVFGSGRGVGEICCLWHLHSGCDSLASQEPQDGRASGGESPPPALPHLGARCSAAWDPFDANNTCIFWRSSLKRRVARHQCPSQAHAAPRGATGLVLYLRSPAAPPPPTCSPLLCLLLTSARPVLCGPVRAQAPLRQGQHFPTGILLRRSGNRGVEAG